jgi:hypothetical protein
MSGRATLRLYYEDAELRTFTAQVLEHKHGDVEHGDVL